MPDFFQLILLQWVCWTEHFENLQSKKRSESKMAHSLKYTMQIIKTKNRSEIWNYLRDADYDVRALLTGQIIELKVHL